MPPPWTGSSSAPSSTAWPPSSSSPGCTTSPRWLSLRTPKTLVLSQIGSGEPFGNDSLELSDEDDAEKEEVDDDDDEDGDWEDEGGWLPSGGNNTRHENPKNDKA